MEVSVVMDLLVKSFMINLRIFGTTLIFALPLGLLVAFGAMNKWAPFARLGFKEKWKPNTLLRIVRGFRPISLLTNIIVWIIRGTPLMLQIIVIFYGPGLLGWNIPPMDRVVAAIVAFVINYACYFSEIYRGGILAVPVGQQEAGQVLGMTKTQIFFKVTLLQLIKRIVPPMGNEFLTLVKDTALANIIANKEIIMMAKEFAPKGMIWPLFFTAFYFLLVCGILTVLLKLAEKKLDYFR